MAKGVLEERRPLATSCEGILCTKGVFFKSFFFFEIFAPIIIYSSPGARSNFAHILV